MATLTSQNTRTLTGYVITLLEYPRWIIEREVDFTHCHLGGNFEGLDERCVSCCFGVACRWLNTNHAAPSPDTPLNDLVHALGTAVQYLQSSSRDDRPHPRRCECDTCAWLHEARSFLRKHRHDS